MIDMNTTSSMFAFGIIITFCLFIIGAMAQSNLMPGSVVMIMIGLFVLSRMLVK